MIDAHEREVLEAKLVEQALSIEELTNSLRSVEGAHDGVYAPEGISITRPHHQSQSW